MVETKFCIELMAENKELPRYKQNTTISHVELYHFYSLPYVVFLLDPLLIVGPHEKLNLLDFCGMIARPAGSRYGYVDYTPIQCVIIVFKGTTRVRKSGTLCHCSVT